MEEREKRKRDGYKHNARTRTYLIKEFVHIAHIAVDIDGNIICSHVILIALRLQRQRNCVSEKQSKSPVHYNKTHRSYKLHTYNLANHR